MIRWAWAGVGLLAALSSGQTRVSPTAEALLRPVKLTEASRLDANVQTRVAYFEALATRKSRGVPAALAEAIGTDSEHRALLCETAVYVSGAHGKAFAAEFKGTPAVALCTKALPQVTERALEGVFGTNREVALKTLETMAAGFDVPPVRLLLQGVSTRDVAADAIAGELLLARYRLGKEPAGTALLKVARAEDAPAVNRVLAYFAPLKDAQRARLSSTDKQVRKEALRALAALAPLSLAELQVGLGDTSAELRLYAAQAIAAGEQRSVAQALEARFQSATPSTAEERCRWLVVLADARGPDCERVARALVSDSTLGEAVQSQALTALAACAGEGAAKETEAFAGNAAPGLRATAAAALRSMPRAKRVDALVDQLLRDVEPRVLQETLKTVAALRLSAQKPVVAALLASTDSSVRSEALRTQALLDPRQAELSAGRLLKNDADAAVRIAAVETLEAVGGPVAVASLLETVRSDGDQHVKLAADAALHRLGYATPRRLR